MTDKLQLRAKIKSFFSSIGAEVALYEKDLTPSIDKMTYRQDILATDFVIFIIDDKYGNKTDAGISGTQEEFEIVCKNKKPCHVYLKLIEKTDEANRFERLIIQKGFSVYYYKDNKDLLSKIKSTSFTLAKNIVDFNIINQGVDPAVLSYLAVKNDYGEALIYCKIFERVLEISRATGFDCLNSNLLIATMEDIVENKLCRSPKFIDKKLDELVNKFCESISHAMQQIGSKSVPNSNVISYEFPYVGQISLSRNIWNPVIDHDWQEPAVQDINFTYRECKNYIANMGLEADILKSL